MVIKVPQSLLCSRQIVHSQTEPDFQDGERLGMGLLLLGDLYHSRTAPHAPLT